MVNLKIIIMSGIWIDLNYAFQFVNAILIHKNNESCDIIENVTIFINLAKWLWVYNLYINNVYYKFTNNTIRKLVETNKYGNHHTR